MNKRILAAIFTLIALILASGLGYVFYSFPNETLSVIIGGICLMFIRHVFVVIRYMLDENK